MVLTSILATPAAKKAVSSAIAASTNHRWPTMNSARRWRNCLGLISIHLSGFEVGLVPVALQHFDQEALQRFFRSGLGDLVHHLQAGRNRIGVELGPAGAKDDLRVEARTIFGYDCRDDVFLAGRSRGRLHAVDERVVNRAALGDCFLDGGATYEFAVVPYAATLAIFVIQPARIVLTNDVSHVQPTVVAFFGRRLGIAEVLDFEGCAVGMAEQQLARDAGRAVLAVLVYDAVGQGRHGFTDAADRADTHRVDRQTTFGSTVELDDVDIEAPRKVRPDC